MVERFRRVVDEELAGERAPSVAGLIDRAIHDGRRMRRLRVMRTAVAGGFAAAALTGLAVLAVLAATVPARGPEPGVAGGTSGGPVRVATLQDSHGRAVQVNASDEQQVHAFVQCMVEHGIEMGVHMGRPTPAAPPTVPSTTAPTPSNNQFDKALKECDRRVPGVYDPSPGTNPAAEHP
jgi:hypothetical protein